MTEFKDITIQLMNSLPQLEKTYRDGNEVERSRSFFTYVKNETDTLFILLDTWVKNVTALAESKQVKIAPQQIIATQENMQALIMHSYYKDVRRRQYMEIQQACDYIFMQCLEENQ